MEANRKHLQEHDDGSDHHQLPDEILAHVLGCLPPSSLAAARCVRKHWCSLIDARRLLRADLLPLHLDAFFVNPTDLESRPSFFAPPSATRRITGLLDFSDTLKEFLYMDIRDHCNGLLLLADVVVNPATRQCSSLLPEFPEGLPIMTSIAGPMHPKCYLVYDPMVSPQHYEMGWVLKSNIDLVEEIPLHHFANKYSKSWTVARYNQESPVQDEIDEWDFDDGIILKTTDNKSHKPRWLYAMVFLGFHPYKEIVFFCISSMALSYHLNTSKVQVLGSLHVTETERSFPYMACWESFENN
ncbi:hypothetical protein HU200_037046 [Digitaria exilis]|uniref:F-box domain-containing protein n=1 Tax=Digitaria exilis TaxID=1010633 RepID=A0A835BFE9_9POAL|nr:hypothetical protein HU200_037046 [Digitaria exilis]